MVDEHVRAVPNLGELIGEFGEIGVDPFLLNAIPESPVFSLS